jgi:hypothetical protein
MHRVQGKMLIVRSIWDAQKEDKKKMKRAVIWTTVRTIFHFSDPF